MKRSLFVLSLILLSVIGVACGGLVPEPTPIPPSATATSIPTATPTIVWFPATDTPTPAPTRVIEPTPEMRPGVGTTILKGGFDSVSNWKTGSFEAGNIAIANNTLTLAVQQSKGFLLSLRNEPVIGQFYTEFIASPSLCREEDAYGVVIQAASEWDYYRFSLNCNGFARAERVRNSQTILLQDWTPVGVLPGALLPVKMGVWAYNGEMRLFVNDAFIFSVRDPIFTSGQIGFYARAAGDSALTVTFSDLQISQLIPAQIPPTPTVTPLP